MRNVYVGFNLSELWQKSGFVDFMESSKNSSANGKFSDFWLIFDKETAKFPNATRCTTS